MYQVCLYISANLESIADRKVNNQVTVKNNLVLGNDHKANEKPLDEKSYKLTRVCRLNFHGFIDFGNDKGHFLM